jgi:acetyl esterase/lipase
MRFTAGLTIALAALLAAPAVGQDPSMKPYQESRTRASAPTLIARYGPDELRSGHLRLPEGKGPFPVAVIVHGGCWRADFDNINGLSALADALAKRGVATWAIGYRRLGDAGAGWPGTFQDVSAGVDHIAVLAKKHRLDMKRVSIVGHSAGAHLALWAASRAKLGGAWRPKVKPVSVVAIDGPGALAPFVGIDEGQCGRPVITELMGGKPADRAAEYRLATPADHLPLGMRQLLVQGTFTPFMAPYAAAARAAGDPVEVLQAGQQHFDVVTPGTPNGDKVVDLIVARAFAPR